MKKRKFYITGYKPIYGKQGNDLLKVFDLGIDGFFIKFAEEITVTLENNITEEKLLRQPDAIKIAYEKSGYIDVTVIIV